MNSPSSLLADRHVHVVYTPDTWEFRGEKYDIMYVSYRDDEHGEEFTTTESDTVWYNQATNQYRAKYGIPYTDEIVALRERYGVSAAKMSLILGFGVNQYRLYEMGEVPSESNGKMIRGAMNPYVFLDLVRSSRQRLTEREYAKISARVEEVIGKADLWRGDEWASGLLFHCSRGIENGFAPQSPARLKNLLLYVIGQMGDVFQTKMNKVLFYVDFLSYRERGMDISGLAYDAIDFGPVPQRWDRVYSAFDDIIPQQLPAYGQETVVLTADADADMSLFTDGERVIIDTVCQKLKDLSAHDLSELSHGEPAWQRHLHEPIPFTEAFNLVGM